VGMCVRCVCVCARVCVYVCVCVCVSCVGECMGVGVSMRGMDQHQRSMAEFE